MNIIQDLNKAFENRVRLGIMSILTVNENVSFKEMKRRLEVTDGNLASHLKALEKNKYIAYKKSFIDRKPNTTYKITALGQRAFKKHISAIEKLLKQ